MKCLAFPPRQVRLANGPFKEKLTSGKGRVTIRFQSRPGDIAAGVFGLRLMKRSVAPEPYRSQFVFKDH